MHGFARHGVTSGWSSQHDFTVGRFTKHVDRVGCKWQLHAGMYLLGLASGAGVVAARGSAALSQ